MPICTGIIGLGYWGPNVLRNFAAQPNCHMKYGCDLSDHNIEKMRAQFPAITFTKHMQDMFQDPDVQLVLIATPTSTHFPLAKAALEAGKHVFIEKPMCGTAQEASSLVKIAEECKRQIFVDHTFAFAPSVKLMHDYVQEGKMGDLLYFDSTRINLGIIQPDTNVLWDLAIHDLTILSMVKNLGSVTELCAHGSKYYGKQIEVGHLHMKFDDGFMAHIHVSWLSPVKIRHTILAGTKAMITYDDTEPSEKIRLYDKGITRNNDTPNPMFPTYRSGDITIPALPAQETLAIEAAHVLSCIERHTTPIVSGHDGHMMLRILEKANESLNTGLPILLANHP